MTLYVRCPKIILINSFTRYKTKNENKLEVAVEWKCGPVLWHWASRGEYLAVRVLVDAVVVDAALVPQRDAALAGARLRLAHLKHAPAVNALLPQLFHHKHPTNTTFSFRTLLLFQYNHISLSNTSHSTIKVRLALKIKHQFESCCIINASCTYYGDY